MAWLIRSDKGVERSLAKLDQQIAKRITSKLREIANLDDPRSVGKPLVGNLAGMWRYRVGDYRIICYIDDGELVILVVDVDYRSEVYR